MADEQSDDTDSPASILRRAEDLRAQGDHQFRESLTLFRRAYTATSDPHERGLIGQQAWEIEQRIATSSPYFSQASQDRYLDERFFMGKRDGVFVEIGGYNGITGSNCVFFEAFRGWTGILVEPSPRLREMAAKVRRATCVEAAVAAEDGSAEFIHVTGGYMQMSGLSDTYDKGILNSVRKNPVHREEHLTVPTRRLEAILREHQIEHADLCSLDVEGAELSILASFPFNHFEIDAWTVENASSSNEIRSVMEANGYQLSAVLGADEIYTHGSKRMDR